jgi:hypothetical protein
MCVFKCEKATAAYRQREEIIEAWKAVRLPDGGTEWDHTEEGRKYGPGENWASICVDLLVEGMPSVRKGRTVRIESDHRYGSIREGADGTAGIHAYLEKPEKPIHNLIALFTLLRVLILPQDVLAVDPEGLNHRERQIAASRVMILQEDWQAAGLDPKATRTRRI